MNKQYQKTTCQQWNIWRPCCSEIGKRYYADNSLSEWVGKCRSYISFIRYIPSNLSVGLRYLLFQKLNLVGSRIKNASLCLEEDIKIERGGAISLNTSYPHHLLLSDRWFLEDFWNQFPQKVFTAHMTDTNWTSLFNQKPPLAASVHLFLNFTTEMHCWWCLCQSKPR